MVKGGRVSIPEFTFSLDDDGNTDANSLSLELGLDLTPTFLESALDRLVESRSAYARLLAADAEDDSEGMGSALKADCKASLQSVVASVSAVEAFYAVVKLSGNFVPREMTDSWRRKGTARRRQVGETLRRAFKQSNQGAMNSKRILKDIYRWRDWAVHPSAAYSKPAAYPEIRRAVDIRFCQFRYRNSLVVAGCALTLIHGLMDQGSPQTRELENYCAETLEKIADSKLRYDEEFLEDAKQAGP